MPDEFERYAVYWVPGRSDGLARFGASWMGWCAERGEIRPRPVDFDHAAEMLRYTRDVSRHGLHGVVSAPFVLGQGRSRWSVERALQAVADRLPSFTLPRLEFAMVDGRVSLAPVQSDTANCAALDDAVARVAAAIAPLTDADGILADSLSGRSQRMVTGGDTLGQRPATSAHRFHVPLTDRPDLRIAFRIIEQLKPRVEPLLGEVRRFTDLALMGDPGGGRPLRVLQRFELSELPARQTVAALACMGRQTLVPTPSDSLAGAGIAI